MSNPYLTTDIVGLVVASSFAVLTGLTAADYRGWNHAMWRLYLATTPRVFRWGATEGYQRFVFGVQSAALSTFVVFDLVNIFSRA
jgi:hypothetical protein